MVRVPEWLSLALLAGLLLAACSKAVAPTDATTPPSTKEGQPVIQADWEQRWNTVLGEGKKESTVAIYTSWPPEAKTSLTAAFKSQYGINLEFTPYNRSAELLAKVLAEQRAGLFNADVFGAGLSTLLLNMKQENLLGSLKPMLILPEVLDPKGWRAGKVPLTDDQGLAISLIGVLTRSVVYNTDLVKEREIASYEDLLKPQYKGRITLNDPSVTGPGNGVITHLGYSLWGEAKTTEFLRKLIRDQQVVVQRDSRLHMESAARGKFAIAVAPLPDLIAEFSNVGAPIRVAMVREDNRVTAAAGGLGVPTRLAHPNAATVFVNWLLTKEGQTVFAKSFGAPSTRADVSVESIDPMFVPAPGETYYLETEDAMQARVRWLELARKIMEEAGR